MDICLVFDKLETPKEPVILVPLRRLRLTHYVRTLNVRTLTGAEAIAREKAHPLADLYFLKSHLPQALDLASSLEQRGALVINSWASTCACQDRVLMTKRMQEAGLPWPQTWSFSTLESLLSNQDVLMSLPFPLHNKSSRNYEHDLMCKVQGVEQLQALAPRWYQEPVILQESIAGDGWDVKLWMIDQQLFAARRRSPLECGEPQRGFHQLASEEIPREWVDIVQQVGRTFGLCIYGVDLIITEQGPVVIDVNAFPTCRGAIGPHDAILALVDRLDKETHRTSSPGIHRRDHHINQQIRLYSIYTFQASSSQVFRGLLDPAMLKRCLPGCKSIEYLDPTHIEIRFGTSLPAFRGPYKAVIRIVQSQEPNLLVFQIQRRFTEGSLRVMARIETSDETEGAQLTFHATIDLEGFMESATIPLRNWMTWSFLRSFFKRVNKAMSKETTRSSAS